MNGGMNRQYRREMKRQERQRQKRAERAAERRQRVRERFRTRRRRARDQQQPGAEPRPPLRRRVAAWWRRPYKAEDLLLLLLAAWGLRWASFTLLGVSGDAAPGMVALGVLVAQGLFLVVVAAYLRGLAGEGLEWYGPPDRRVSPLLVWGGGLAGGAVLYAAGRAASLLLQNFAPQQASLVVAAGGLAEQARQADPLTLVLLLLGFALVSPVTDELFYRRLLARLFGRVSTPYAWTLLFSAFLYSLGAVAVLPVPALLLLGLGLAYAYMQTRSTGLILLMGATQATLRLFLG